MKRLIILYFLYSAINTFSQSLQHPTIFVTQSERASILQLIEDFDWAKSIKIQLHKEVDSILKIHQNNPREILKNIPPFANNSKQYTEFEASPFASNHNKILSLASRSAMLYYLTQDVKYAMFSADLLAPYINELSNRTPKNTSICGNSFYDSRTTYGPFAIAYDFIHSYLQSPIATVFDAKMNKRIPFDNSKAQKTIINIVGDVLQEFGPEDKHGTIVSNHPILTGPGALFPILCVENDAERERLLNVFLEKGTKHQNSFVNTILPIFGKQGIWPESLSYSFMPIITLMINIIDRVKPELNFPENYKHIFEGNFLFDNLRNPDRSFVRYGDSKRNSDQTETLYRYTLHLAARREYKDLIEKAQISLKQLENKKGKYSPTLTNEMFNNYGELHLFWGIPLPDTIKGKIDFQKPTVIIDHAGIALQRNTSKKDNVNYGLTGIIGGAHYVHSHVTGIAMELYGAGYVMVPNGGLPKSVKERRIPLHEKYFRLYAGNNTVVVNGTSHGLDKGSWKENANVWQNTVKNIAAEPKHLENPISDDFNFATQLLEDEVNNARQQRTLGIIRTSDTSGYYFDLFRSKSNEKNIFHDYIHHNIGDKTEIVTSDQKKVEFEETDRYQNDIGDVVQSPGWRFFKKTKSSKPITSAINIRFDIHKDTKAMHMFVPNGVEKEYTKSIAPPTREAKNGYDKKDTQVVVIRQKGEAWDTPFIAIFEPTIGKESTVKIVEELRVIDKIVGAKVISNINGKEITDFIICNDTNESIYISKFDIKFKGHYAIVRCKQINGKEKVTLYIGDGQELEYKGKKMTAEKNDSRAFKIF